MFQKNYSKIISNETSSEGPNENRFLKIDYPHHDYTSVVKSNIQMYLNIEFKMLKKRYSKTENQTHFKDYSSTNTNISKQHLKTFQMQNIFFFFFIINYCPTIFITYGTLRNYIQIRVEILPQHTYKSFRHIILAYSLYE